MGVYLSAKFEVSSIILTSFRQGVTLPPPNSKRTPKKPIQIRVNMKVKCLNTQLINLRVTGLYGSA